MPFERKESKFIDVLSSLGFYLIDFLKNQYYFDMDLGKIKKRITFNYLPFVTLSRTKVRGFILKVGNS
jgi:hypothetical protein